jgi:hypothetical protein
MLVVTNPKFLGDEVVVGHVLLPGRSMHLRYVDDFDMLLIVAMENFVVSSSRRDLASSCILGASPLQLLVRWVLVEGLLHSSATKTTGRPCMDRSVIFLFFKGAFVRVAM